MPGTIVWVTLRSARCEMRVFISYSRKDAVRANAIAECLRAIGHDVFIDSRLTSGSAFRSELERELRAADRVVVLWTKSSVDSSWVREEASLAQSLAKISPVAFGIQPPLGFRELHTPRCDLTSTPETVVAALQLSSGPAPPPPPPRPTIDLEDWHGGGRLRKFFTRPR